MRITLILVVVALALAGCESGSLDRDGLVVSAGSIPQVASPTVVELSLRNVGQTDFDNLLIVGRNAKGEVLFGPQEFDFHLRDQLDLYAPSNLSAMEIEGFTLNGVKPIFEESVDVRPQAGLETSVPVDATPDFSPDGTRLKMHTGSIRAQDTPTAALVIERVTTTPLPCAADTNLTATVEASSRDGLVLSYSWSSDWAIVGDPTSASVTLHAPPLAKGANFAMGQARVTVTDSAGNSAVVLVQLFSTTGGLVFEQLSYDKPVLGSTELAASFKALLGSTLTYEWNVGGSTINSGTLDNLARWTWTPLGFPGLTRVVVKATNGQGLAAEGSAILRSVRAGWCGFGADLQTTRRISQTVPSGAPSQKWTAEFSGSPVVGDDGTVYAVTEGQALNALYPNGSVKWTVAIEGASANTLALAARTLYLVAGKKVVAVGLDGKVLWWSVGVGAAQPFVLANGTVIASDPQSGRGPGTPGRPILSALSSQGGSLLWTTILPGWGQNADITSDPDGFLYVSTTTYGSGEDPARDRRVLLSAVDPRNGTILWTRTPGESKVGPAPAVGDDGTIYFAGNGNENAADGRLFAYRQDGSLKWVTNLPGTTVEALAVAADGSPRVATVDFQDGQRLQCYLNALSVTGDIVWSSEVGTAPATSIFTTSDGGCVLSARGISATGQLLWTGGRSFTAVGPDGTFYSNSPLSAWR